MVLPNFSVFLSCTLCKSFTLMAIDAKGSEETFVLFMVEAGVCFCASLLLLFTGGGGGGGGGGGVAAVEGAGRQKEGPQFLYFHESRVKF